MHILEHKFAWKAVRSSILHTTPLTNQIFLFKNFISKQAYIVMCTLKFHKFHIKIILNCYIIQFHKIAKCVYNITV